MIRKAVIPMAGQGTRMRPISSAVPKGFLPLVDPAGHGRCVLHEVLREAAAGGIEQAAVVVSPGQQEGVARYRQAATEAGDSDGVADVTCVAQTHPGGLGDAVLQARAFVGDEPFMVLLGDHLRLPTGGAVAATRQLADVWDRTGGASVVGMQAVGADELCRVGVGAGPVVEAGKVYRCARIIEKPDVATARKDLTSDLGPDVYLAHAGVYAFDPEIFDCLASQQGGAGELGLTESQHLLMTRRPDECYLVKLDATVYDVGHPAGYADAFDAFRRTGAAPDA